MSIDVEALSIDHLTASENMSLIGILWDSLGEQVNAADIPDWHRTELDRNAHSRQHPTVQDDTAGRSDSCR